MADSDFATLVSKDRDANSQTNQIFVGITDGTELALVDASGNLNVILAANDGVDIGDVDVTSVIPGVGATNLGKAVDAVGGAADVGVALLALRDDALTTLTPVDGDYVRLRVNSTGALHVTSTSLDNSAIAVDDSAFTVAVDSVSVSGFLADETTPDSVDEGDIGAARMTLDRKILTRIVGASDADRLDVNATGQAQIDIAATSLAASTPIPVSATAAQNTALNPIFVQVVSTALTSDEIHDYDTAAALASDTADNHDYTVTGATFLLKSVIFAASGGLKAEIQTGPLASLVTIAVGFIVKQGGVHQLFFDPPREVPVASTGTIRVIRTNRQGAAQDVYSTIIGNDVA